MTGRRNLWFISRSRPTVTRLRQDSRKVNQYLVRSSLCAVDGDKEPETFVEAGRRVSYVVFLFEENAILLFGSAEDA